MRNSGQFQLKTIADKRYAAYFLISLLAVLAIYALAFNIKKYSDILRDVEDDGYYQGYFEQMLLSDREVDANISRYAKNLNRFFIYHRNFLNSSDSDLVTPMDVAEETTLLQQNFYASQQRAIDAFNEAAYNERSTEEDIKRAENQLNAALRKIVQNYREEMEAIRAAKLKEKKENYRDVENYLNSTKEFRYYIYDLVLNKAFTNIVGIDIDYYAENETVLIVDLSQITETYNGVELNLSFERGGIRGYIMIPKEQPPQSLIAQSIQRVGERAQDLGSEPRRLIIRYSLLLLAPVLALVLVFQNMRRRGLAAYLEGAFSLFRGYLKAPSVVKLFALVWGIGTMLDLAYPPLDILASPPVAGGMYFLRLYGAVLAVIAYAFFVIYIVGDSRRLKNEPEYVVVSKLLEDLRLVRLFSPFLITFIWVFMLFVNAIIIFYIINISLNAGFAAESLLFTIVGALVCGILIVTMDIISCFSKLGYYIGVIEGGEVTEVPEQRGLFSGPVNKLNMLGEGLYRSLDETLKLERSKTELITNVSHDLKTPLTSIINYVELLRGLGLKGEAGEYLEVLWSKSQRLKILIDDLFEAAKLSSHTMELNMEPVDAVQLFRQAIGELCEKIEDKGLDLRFNADKEKIILDLDGKRMWRVFENLLGNIINYSPEGSRAYIDMEDGPRAVRITLKNISRHELLMEPGDLFERFKRGDSARTTEGSGLGLSIAKNIVDLHGGKMDIVIDGDLFKTVIVLYK